MKPLVINLVDYGMGNLGSVRNALERLGCEVRLSDSAATWASSSGIVLPGVGAFGEAMNNLRARRLVEPLQRAVLEDECPLLGICLGMQLLADTSMERGKHGGLSFIPGEVRQIPVGDGLRLPHIGWNDVSVRQSDPLFWELPRNSAFYFVHSYYFECDRQYVGAETDYGGSITAAVQKEHVFGVQFHPERSQRKGLQLLRNFLVFIESRAGAEC